MTKARAGDKGTTIHRKANGVAYLYAVESYWDKEKKQPRNKQVCLGRLDENTGEVIPSKKKEDPRKPDAAVDVTANAKVYGPYLLLTKLAKDTGLVAALKKSFPDTHDEILSLAYFLAQKGLALSRCEIWSASHMHPAEKIINSQRVSELLQHITENRRERSALHDFPSLQLGRTPVLCSPLLQRDEGCRGL